ncbi:MAG: hypothetical protein CME69_11420 [Halobacteriovorax sp.]|nr:hypothetical protein [Halobacteriovorax sp.]|tara:strand:- start:219 stop:599 length:381 start_codon:yes stop_codon:yes gene_type:complete
MNEEIKNKDVVVKKKRGRRPKDTKVEYELNMEQTKFFVDLSKEKDDLKKIQELLIESNEKNHGREVLFKDIALYAISKLTKKDIEKIQENSLTEMEKVERSLEEYNQKNGTKLNLGEYLLKKLNLN